MIELLIKPKINIENILSFFSETEGQPLGQKKLTRKSTSLISLLIYDKFMIQNLLPNYMKEEDLIPFSNRAYKTNLKIGDNVSIGAHAIILPGVREIGEGSIIQAGAIVDRPVPPNVIIGGNPAKVVRKIPSIVHRTKH